MNHFAANSGDRFYAFPTTHWSVVEEAGKGSIEGKRLALASLLKQYLPALRSHLLNGNRIARNDADDLLQSFITDKVLVQEVVARAQRQRGRFRNFLLVTLDHFVVNVIQYNKALKRSPSGQCVPLDAAAALADSTGSPSENFDVAWARQVLATAIEQMEAECRARARPDIWGVFDARVLGPTLRSTEPVPYDDLVTRLGFASPSQATNVLVTANRMFVRNIRAVVGAYTRDEAEIDEEIEDLRRILAGAGARSSHETCT